jgi:pentatricopeptide repeat protein
VWHAQVQPGYLKPATGSCLSVLALAARHGDVHLATDVFRVLTARETVFTTHHYELLISTYLNAGDLSAALSVILIMVDANLRINEGTCQPLFLYMRNEEPSAPSRPMAAFNLLQDLEAAGRKVPTAAINACIQATISLKRFEEAIEIYKALHTVSHSGPNTQTFNILFRGCHMNARKELAMFFANEMIQLNLKPDQLTYDRLICVCLQADDIEDALLYYQEMRSLKAKPGSAQVMKPRRGTWELLIGRCVALGDDRAVALLKDYKQDQDEPRIAVERAVKARFEEGIIISRDPRAKVDAGETHSKAQDQSGARMSSDIDAARAENMDDGLGRLMEASRQ